MNKFSKFALKTVLGPFAIWCGAGLLLCASIAVSPLLGAAGGPLVCLMSIVQLAAAFVYVAAFVMSLAEREGGRALAQAFLGLAGLFLLVVGVAASTFANFDMSSANSKSRPSQSASVTNETAAPR